MEMAVKRRVEEGNANHHLDDIWKARVMYECMYAQLLNFDESGQSTSNVRICSDAHLR